MGDNGDEGPDGLQFVHVTKYEEADDEIDSLNIAQLWKIKSYFF